MEERIEPTVAVPTEAVSMPTPTKGEMRRAFSRMALVLCLGLLLSQLIPALLAFLPGFDVKAHSFLVGGLGMGCFTLPLMLLLTRSLPTRKPDRHGLSAGGFLALVCICYGAMILGNLVGIVVNGILSPNSLDLISNLATSSDTSLEMVLAFVVVAPVFEELVFRKALVDRVLPYGEWPAILFSGLCFGLYHGNLSQFFYTGLLGMMLAYIYIRTGNILYTIGLHACLNFLGGVVPTLFPAASYGVMLIALAGVVLFFRLRKHIHVEKNAVPGVGEAMFGNAGMILYLLLSILLIGLVVIIMNHPELMGGL